MLIRLPRRRLVASAAGSAVLAIAALAFGPCVRSRVASEAAARRLSVTLGGVGPAWFAVRLLDVGVSPDGLPSVRLHVDEVRVHLALTLSVTRLEVEGAALLLSGSPDGLWRDLTDWRSRSAHSATQAQGRLIPLTVAASSFRWDDGSVDGPFAELHNVAASRDAAGFHLGVGDGRVHFGAADAVFSDFTSAFGPEGSLTRARARALRVEWSDAGPPAEPLLPPRPEPDPTAPPVSVAPVPAPPAHSTRKARSARPRLAPGERDVSPADPGPPWFALPDLHGARDRVAAVARLLAARVPDDADIGVDALTWKLVRPGDRLALTVGPGSFSLGKTSDGVALQFQADAERISMPLAVEAILPTHGGDASFTLQGGPASLAWLGVSEGAAGLVDVARATLTGRARLVLAGDGTALTFDGEGRTSGLSIQNGRLATEVVRGIDIDLRARGTMSDAGELRFDDVGATLGSLHVDAAGELVERPDHVAAAFRFDMPETGCQALLGSVPKALLPALQDTTIGGTFRAEGRFAFDTRSLDDLELTYGVDDRCRVLEVPPVLARDHYERPFPHRIRMPDGSITEQLTGPGTPHWTALDRISPYMPIAVLTTEDGGFPHHHGFSRSSIRASLVANLKARKFVRGASTITMQVAKNLFLSRDKTLSRKLEEVVLTDYLEQVFSKDELMELYLNIIEFGPGVYGITDAAAHYFGRSPAELDLAECLFLSSLLPAPLRYGAMRDRGDIPDGWMQTLHTLMQIAHRNGLITDAELAQGESENIVFWRGGPRPDPRPPAHAHTRADGDGSDDPETPPTSDGADSP